VDGSFCPIKNDGVTIEIKTSEGVVLLVYPPNLFKNRLHNMARFNEHLAGIWTSYWQCNAAKFGILED